MVSFSERRLDIQNQTLIEARLVLCNHGEVKDKVHFFLSCPYFNGKRTVIMKVINEIDSSILKTDVLETCNNILSSEKTRIIFSLVLQSL